MYDRHNREDLFDLFVVSNHKKIHYLFSVNKRRISILDAISIHIVNNQSDCLPSSLTLKFREAHHFEQIKYGIGAKLFRL